MSTKTNLAALIAVCAVVAAPAVAGTINGTLNVTVTFNDHCESLSVGTLNFGAHTLVAVATPITQTATIGMDCTVGTTYDIELGSGSYSGNAVSTTRAMKHATLNQYVDYELYTTGGFGTTWSTLPANAVSGTASTTAVSHTVHGRIPAQAIPATGTYNDAVTVTVTY